MIATVSVRRAGPADRDSVLTTLVEAFAEDPLARHLFGDRETLRLRLPTFFGYLLDVGLEGCEVLMADDATAASLWTPPGGNRLGAGPVSARWDAVLPLLPVAFADRYAEFVSVIARSAPAEPHWHLGLLGVRPGCRRHGLARAVCEPMLEQADAEAMPVALETGSRSSLPFYGRLGFDVADQSQLPGGPAVWTMWRDPSGLDAR